jgi:hypothetical protein
MTRRRSLLVLLSLMLVLGLVETVPGVTAQSSKPILIGAPVHPTGFMASYDVPPLEGARLAVKQINAAGGVMVANSSSSRRTARLIRRPSAPPPAR